MTEIDWLRKLKKTNNYDPELIGAFADWLEERGDKRFKNLRSIRKSKISYGQDPYYIFLWPKRNEELYKLCRYSEELHTEFILITKSEINSTIVEFMLREYS